MRKLVFAFLIAGMAAAQASAQQPTVTRVQHPPIVEHADNFQVPSPSDILTRASAAYKKVQSLRADFVQKRQNPLLGSNTTSRGKLYQKRPDRFLLKFTQPSGDVIVADGRYFWVYYPSADKRQVLRAAASQGAAGGVDLQAQFLGDPLHRFTYTFDGVEPVAGRKAYLMTLVPRTNAGYKSLKVWIDAKDYMARRFILTESNGVVQEFTLSNLSINPVLPNSLFHFTPPADARIVDRT
jgi:outer membrane lipoprotein carrier protein